MKCPREISSGALVFRNLISTLDLMYINQTNAHPMYAKCWPTPIITFPSATELRLSLGVVISRALRNKVEAIVAEANVTPGFRASGSTLMFEIDGEGFRLLLTALGRHATPIWSLHGTGTGDLAATLTAAVRTIAAHTSIDDIVNCDMAENAVWEAWVNREG